MYKKLLNFGFKSQQSAQCAKYINSMCTNKEEIERQSTIEPKLNVFFLHENSIYNGEIFVA